MHVYRFARNVQRRCLVRVKNSSRHAVRNIQAWRVAEALIRQGYTYDSHYWRVESSAGVLDKDASHLESVKPPIHLRDVSAFIVEFRRRMPKPN